MNKYFLIIVIAFFASACKYDISINVLKNLSKEAVGAYSKETTKAEVNVEISNLKTEIAQVGIVWD